MKKKFLSYFLSFLMIMSIFTQNTQSLYAQEYDNSDQTVEVQSDSTTDTSKDVADRPQDAGVDVMQTNGEEQDQSDDSITFEGEDSEDERDADLSDIPQSDNLNQFITGVEISLDGQVIDKGDGTDIQVKPDTEYSLKVSFKENDSLQFSDSGVYTYTLPDGISGITMPRPQAISLNMVDSQGSYTIGASYQFIDGKLTFWIDTKDANFERYKKTQNVWLNASFPFKFSSDGEKGTINWGGDKVTNFTYDTSNDLSVSKEGSYDKANGKFNYTVTVKSTGKSENVVVNDAISGTALTFNKDASVDGDDGKGTLTSTNNGFKYTIDEMKDGQTITIKYSANIDYSKLSGNQFTVDETKNTVTAKSDETEKTTEKDFDHYTAYDVNPSKSGKLSDDRQSIDWTITVNPDAKLNYKGTTISDTLQENKKVPMQYTGDGITIKKYDAKGNLVDTQKVNWNSLTSYDSDSGWTYKLTDDEAYKYVITYQTSVDTSKVTTSTTVKNTFDDGKDHKAEGNVYITGEGTFEVSKSHGTLTTDNTMDYSVNVTVPKTGFNESFVVTDYLPHGWYNSAHHKDTYKGNLTITFDGTKFTEGEDYTVETVDGGSGNGDQLVITFNKDKLSKLFPKSDEDKSLRIAYTTNVDTEWKAIHSNSVTASADGTNKNASTSFSFDQSLKKEIKATKTDEDGLLSLTYYVTLKNVDSNTVDVSDVFDTSLLQLDGTAIVGAGTAEWEAKQNTTGQSWNQNYNNGGTLTTTTTDSGVKFSLTPSKNTDGKNYTYYTISYTLKVKNQAALQQMKENALNNGGKYTLANTASWGQNSSNADYDYVIKPVTKTITVDPNKANNYIATFKLTLNEDAQQINKGQSYVITDVMSSTLRYQLKSATVNGEQIDPNIVADGDNTNLQWTIPDGQKVEIVYQARLVGSSGTISYSNQAKIEGTDYSDESSGWATVDHSSEGGGTRFHIMIKKYDEKQTATLEGAQFKLYKVKDGKATLATNTVFTTDANGEAKIEDDGKTWSFDEGNYVLKEVKAPSGYETCDPVSFTLSQTPSSAVEYGDGDTIIIKDKKIEGGLTLTKTISGLKEVSEDLEKQIQFTVTGPNNYSKVYTLADIKNDDGSYSKTITGLEPGTYTVTESNAAVSGYSVTTTYSVNGGDATTAENVNVQVNQDGTASVDVTNNYSELGKLKLTKTISGLAKVTDKIEKQIKFTVTGPNDYSQEYSLVDLKNTDGTYSKTIENLEPGEYTVTESDADVAGYSVKTTYSVDGGKTTVKTGETAEVKVTNDYSKDVGKLKLTKTISGLAKVTDKIEKQIKFTVTGPNDYSQEYSLADLKNTDGTYSKTIENLEPGEYTVTESDADVAGYSVKTTYSVDGGKTTVKTGETAEVKVTNDYSKDVGKLKLTKTISGLDKVTEKIEKQIKFTVTGPNDYSQEYSLADLKNADGTYSKTIENLEPGEYTVTESDADVAGYSVKTTYSVDGGKTTVKTGETAEVKVTNDYSKDVGKLKLTKTISGLDKVTEKIEKQIKFTVTGPNDYSQEYSLADLKNADGTYSKTIENLEPGEYTVTESDADVAGYSVKTTYSVDGGKTTVKTGETAEVKVTNDYSKDVGKLKLTKTISGLDKVTEKIEKQIKFTVTGPNDYSQEYSLADLKNTDGTYSKTIENLEPGEYTVTESDADVAGYSVKTTYSVDGGKTTVKTGETAEVKVTNDYSKDVGKLKLTKTISGLDKVTEKIEKQIKFTVTGPNDYSQEYSLADLKNTDGTYSKTIENLEPGEYTVTESDADVAGYSVKTTYSVDGGKTKVNKSETSTVAVTNEYSKQKGNFKFTKSFSGKELTDKEKEAISFTVTKPDGTQETVKLTDMDYDKASKTYIKTYTDVALGNYTVEENNSSIEGYTKTVKYMVGDQETNVAEVTNGETATVNITNSYDRDKGSLTFTKTINGVSEEAAQNITFTVTGPNEYSKTVSLDQMTKGEDGKYSYTISDLPTGEYTVKESKAGIDGYNVETNYSVIDGKTTVTKAETSTVNITNNYTRKVGSLTFTKSISGLTISDEMKDQITFTVSGNNFNQVVKLSEMTETDGKYSYTIDNLPTGDYTVVESNADLSGYTVKTTYSVDGGKTTVKDTEPATVDITNEYSRDKGSLTFTKSITGVDEDALKNITFTVTGPDNYNKVVKLSDMKGEDGKYSYTISDLPTGEYTVTENNAEVSGYTVTTNYSVKDGKTTVEKGKTAKVDITNKYDRDKGSLTFTKTISGLKEVSEELADQITFTVSGPKDFKEQTIKLSEMTKGEDGQYSYTLSDLPTGNYTVTESNTDVEGYTLTTTYSVDGGKTKVEKEATATVDITNSYDRDKGSLTFTKTLKGVSEEAAQNITFTVTGPEDFSQVVKFSELTKGEDGQYSYTLDNLPTGEYSVIESKAGIDGYKVNTTYSIKDGKTTVKKGETSSVEITNEYSRLVKVSKVDAANNKELEGAKLQITDKKGKVIDTWTSTKDVHIVTLTSGTYTLTELSAPKDYEIAKPITFTIDENGIITVDGKIVDSVIMKDDKSTKPGNTTEKTEGTKTGTWTGLSEMTTLSVASLGAIGLLLKKKKEDNE